MAKYKMNVQIGAYTFTATLEDNDAVRELAEIMRREPVTIDMDDYAGFEKVGSLGRSLTTSNCQPCPARLDIGLINKYYDLARAGDMLAAGHYQKLEKKAVDCIQCGHCGKRCPFHVDQSGRMKEIAAYFSC